MPPESQAVTPWPSERVTYPTRQAAMLEGDSRRPYCLQCVYCQQWFHSARCDAGACGPTCRKALSRARSRKAFRRPTYNEHAESSSACSSAEERAMRDLAALRVRKGSSRWDNR